MPVKQRASGRRIDPDVELKAWKMTFKGGFDYLKSLPKIGVPISEATPPSQRTRLEDARPSHQPDRAVAEDAWHRLGDQYLADRDPEAPPCWAEREFGPPTEEPARRRAGGARRRR